ncbi:MAG: hypothetical protein H6923_00635 [Alphaproteobacteria bacterium]|nr:hypothetical protein [Alphaproteobacteria bacterium]
MKRSQRRSHLFQWTILLPLVLVLFALALYARPGVPATDETNLIESRLD